MAKTRSALVAQAKAWLGCKESDGSFRKIIDVYNAHKPLARGYAVQYTDEWCATFVSACAIKTGMTDILPTECSCNKMIALFKNLGIWVENDAYVPKAGDVIMYDWQDSGSGDNTGSADHVGIVTACDGSTITVIEGNKNGEVAYRRIAVNGRYIRGFGVPKYEAESSTAASTTSSTTTTATKSVATVAQEVIDGKWGNGSARKTALEKAGYKYSEVQAEVNRIINGASTAAASYYTKYTGNSTSIVDALKAIGVDSSYIHREKIAKVNGITNYSGTSIQNGKLLVLLKTGKLIKA